MVQGRTLLLLRHGRTDWNLAGRVQGQSDSELDETGHAQARATAAAIAVLRPGLLWSSDLARAAVTASYVAEACDLTPVTDSRLREYSLAAREGLFHHAYEEQFPEEWATFRTGRFDVVPEGEKTADVVARMCAALGGLLEATPPGGLSVAVSHGAALTVAIASLLGWEEAQTLSLGALDNCGWSLLVEHPGSRALRLAAHNRTVPCEDPNFT